jgi:hypothetical protein
MPTRFNERDDEKTDDHTRGHVPAKVGEALEQLDTTVRDFYDKYNQPTGQGGGDNNQSSSPNSSKNEYSS